MRVADFAFARALLYEQQREDELLAQLQARGEEEAACVEALSLTLSAVRQEQSEERAERERCRLEAPRAGAGADAGAGAGLARGNSRLAEECEQLRERLTQVREESTELEHACPSAEEAAVQERLECSHLRTELEAEQRCVERSELEASALQSEVEEATSLEHAFCSEVAQAVARNALLEEEHAEVASESRRAWSSAQVARQRLDSHNSSLASLRGVVKDHTQRVRERLSKLEHALFQVPGLGTIRGAADMGLVEPAASQACTEEADAKTADPAGNDAPSCSRRGRANAAGALHVPSSADDDAPTSDAELGAGRSHLEAAPQPLVKRLRSWGRGQACSDLDQALPGLAC